MQGSGNIYYPTGGDRYFALRRVVHGKLLIFGAPAMSKRTLQCLVRTVFKLEWINVFPNRSAMWSLTHSDGSEWRVLDVEFGLARISLFDD